MILVYSDDNRRRGWNLNNCGAILPCWQNDERLKKAETTWNLYCFWGRWERMKTFYAYKSIKQVWKQWGGISPPSSFFEESSSCFKLPQVSSVCWKWRRISDISHSLVSHITAPLYQFLPSQRMDRTRFNTRGTVKIIDSLLDHSILLAL